MRFMKPQGNEKRMHARWCVLFIRREIKEKSCFPTGTIYGFTRRNCDVLCLDPYGEVPCAEKQCYKLALVRKSADITAEGYLLR